MIYIDPPYNTGNDFIYKDDFSESAEEYHQKTGQRGEEGERLVANPKSGGRFHGNWLNMIYPRLLLARDLLREDGVIFVSIDDNEVHNLRQVMDEVFGGANFAAEIVWEKMYTAKNDSSLMSASHEYILAYLSNSAVGNIRLLPRSEEADQRYRNPDGDERGPWKAIPLYANEERKNGRFPIRAPNGRIHELGPNKHWRVSEAEVARLIRDHRIYFGLDGNSQPNLKLFLSEVRQGMKAKTLWKYDEVGSNDSAKRELKDLFPDESEPIFPFPKPSTLIGQCLKLVTSGVEPDEIVVDFFAGSGATAHSVYAQNVGDSGSRRFILVQLPESSSHQKYPTIAEISKERIRRVIKKLKAEQKEAAKAAKQTKLDLDTESEPAESLDLGFRVFKIEDSQFKRWADFEGEDVLGYQARLDEAAQHPLRPGWVAEAVLTEIALQEGFPLDSAIEAVPEFKRNAVRLVSHNSSQHRLFVCLDERIYADTIANVHLGDQDIFICFDHALGDEAKLRLADACKLKVI
jgi:adenine-specific DNA-methyltransferase